MNLTQEEYEQLEAIRVLYPWAKYVARDNFFCEYETNLHVYEAFPKRNYTCDETKDCEHWNVYDTLSNMAPLNQELFPSLTWESEPLNIDEALEGRGCCPSCGRRLEGENELKNL